MNCFVLIDRFIIKTGKDRDYKISCFSAEERDNFVAAIKSKVLSAHNDMMVVWHVKLKDLGNVSRLESGLGVGKEIHSLASKC